MGGTLAANLGRGCMARCGGGPAAAAAAAVLVPGTTTMLLGSHVSRGGGWLVPRPARIIAIGGVGTAYGLCAGTAGRQPSRDGAFITRESSSPQPPGPPGSLHIWKRPQRRPV